jgi:ABC-type branched-subunit amino acid transport system ATPase component/ABC-type branched-subunit amino acid transport system permease subunit
MLLTLGISQVLLALTYVPQLTPSSQKLFPQPFTSNVSLGGVVLSGMSLLTMIVVPAVLVILTVFLEFTSVGKQIRAAAGNPQAARLCGVSVDRVSLITWGIAGGLSALSAVLNGPTTSSFNAAAVGPYLLMFTMGAAAFGAFVSIPAAVAGGVGLGVVYQVVAQLTSNAGTAELVVFGTILVIILVRGRAIGRVFAAEGAAVPERPGIRVPEVLRGSVLFRSGSWWLAGAAVVVAVVIPRLPYFDSGPNQFLLVIVLVYALIAVSLTMLLGWAGQVSMGHFALAGLAAYLTARWAGGWSLPALIVVTGLVGAATAVAIGLPALRVRGLTLAVATLGLAVIAPDWLYLQPWIGGSTPFTTPVASPTLLPGVGTISSSLYLYYVVLIVLVLAVAAAAALRRSAMGRVIIAVRDNERASAAFGIRPDVVKVRVLAVSGFIAAMAGMFYAIAWQSVSPSLFSANASIALLAIPVIGGLGSIGGALTAAVLLYTSTFFIGPHVSVLLGSFGQNTGFLLFFSGIGIVVTMLQIPNGIAGKVESSWQAYLNRKAKRMEAEPAVATPVAAARMTNSLEAGTPDADLVELPSGPAAAVGPGGLVTRGTHAQTDRRKVSPALPDALPLAVQGVSIHFGGIAALDEAEIVVRPGEIVGLIGPNGAGKTTLMNVISGVLKPARGSVKLFGHEVSGQPPTVRARYGLARSFQDATLFAGLTVTETIQVALAHQSKARLLPVLVTAPWVRAAERDSRRRARDIVHAFGLQPWADALAVELSTGLRRICDLAAQVAAEPQLVLLDEPAAGVAQREAEAFGPLVRRIRDHLDCSVLIIEHDMPLLMGLCDRVYAMEAGRVIAEGTPVEIREDPLVVASYLGTEDRAISRSGVRAPL